LREKPSRGPGTWRVGKTKQNVFKFFCGGRLFLPGRGTSGPNHPGLVGGPTVVGVGWVGGQPGLWTVLGGGGGGGGEQSRGAGPGGTLLPSPEKPHNLGGALGSSWGKPPPRERGGLVGGGECCGCWGRGGGDDFLGGPRPPGKTVFRVFLGLFFLAGKKNPSLKLDCKGGKGGGELVCTFSHGQAPPENPLFFFQGGLGGGPRGGAGE